MATPTIILVRPQMGENIGAAARVMANFSLNDLHIVNPRDGWPNDAGRAMAAHATHIIDNATIYDSVEKAVADCHLLYATSARPRDMQKRVADVKQAAKEVNASGQKAGILFGPERSGLTNEELILADALLQIPVDSQYPSLNLAQAVGVVCYELFKGELSKNTYDELASKEEIQHLFNHLEESLEENSFFRTEAIKPKMIQNIRAMFTKAQLTSQEVQTLRGIIRALESKDR